MNRYLARRKKAALGRQHGTVSERKAMKDLKAELTPGSGALLTAKSDGFDDVYQYEVKSTIYKTYRLDLEVLTKIKKEARQVGRVPVLLINFVYGTGESFADGEYVVIRRDVFEELKERGGGVY